MKKQVLILSLVLAVVDFAYAGFVITFPGGGTGFGPGGTLNLAWYNDGILNQLSIRVITDSAVKADGIPWSGSISNIYLNEQLQWGRNVGNGLITDGSGYLMYNAAGDGIGGATSLGAPLIAAGTKIFSFDFTIKAEVIAGLYMLNFVKGTWKNDAGVKTQLGNVTYMFPEPMTVGLLGLGTLFIRRRQHQ